MTDPVNRVGAIDIDSSIYQTYRAVDALGEVMSKLYPNRIDAKIFHQEVGEFYFKTDGRSFGHDIEEHLKQQYGLDFDELRPQIIEGMRHHNLVFDDAVSMFKRLLKQAGTDLWFITVGVRKTQELKLELIHSELERRLGHYVAPIPHIILEGKEIIEDNKGRFLSELWRNGFQAGTKHYDEAFVIEDNAEQIGAITKRPGLTLYQIVRKDAKYPPVTGRPDIKIITSLTEVR